MKRFVVNDWIPAFAGMTTKIIRKVKMSRYSAFRTRFRNSDFGTRNFNSALRIPYSAIQNWDSFRLFHSAIRTPNSAFRNGGFTLIEIIILIVIAGILLPVIVVPFVSSVKESGKPEMATTAMFLASQKMEEFMKYQYSDPALNPVALTPYVNSGVTGYDWQWEILYVNSDFNVVNDGISATNDEGYKRILVRVRDPENNTYEVYSVVTFFP